MSGVSVVWPHEGPSPYEVLGVPSAASVADIRQAFKRSALLTHPDKQHQHQSSSPSSSSQLQFHMVKSAAEVLLDPMLRQKYDQLRCQSMIRTVGVCSDTYVLAEDFDEVPEQSVDGAMTVYERECRCGGTYEVFILAERLSGDEGGEYRVRCECDCCSLIVEVIC